jgi:hypothetical protein
LRPLLRTRLLLLTLTPACSCVYICKFQFRPIHPPSRRLSGTQSQAGVPLAGVGCAALTDHFRAALWPPKFRLHLPEKYDRTSNPSEFLQVYVTAITAAGGNTAVMATYFHVALSGPAQTWLMNLAPG